MARRWSSQRDHCTVVILPPLMLMLMLMLMLAKSLKLLLKLRLVLILVLILLLPSLGGAAGRIDGIAAEFNAVVRAMRGSFEDL